MANGARPSPFHDTSAIEIRALVLDYLIHHSYTATARAFAAESVVRHLDADGDEISRPEREGDKVTLPEELLTQAELRRSVRESISSGSVGEALDKLRNYFPGVLSPSPSEPPPATVLAKAATGPPLIRTLAPLTLDPSLLHLDLRLLAFIEASRTVPLIYPQSPVPSYPARSSTDPRDLEALLAQIGELQEMAQELKDPEDRAAYADKFNKVALLIAYKDPEARSTVSKYLAQAQRDEVALEIDHAMLYRSGQSPFSSLELAIRQTCAVFDRLHEIDYRLPASANLPPGIKAPTENTFANPGKKAGSDRDETKAIPIFSLSQFIAS